MQSRFHPMFYIILPLAVIGFAFQFEAILFSLAVPAAIIVVLFAVYLLIQKRSVRPRLTRSSARPGRRQPEKTKAKRTSGHTIPFRVIEGRKKQDDDEPPRYH